MLKITTILVLSCSLTSYLLCQIVQLVGQLYYLDKYLSLLLANDKHRNSNSLLAFVLHFVCNKHYGVITNTQSFLPPFMILQQVVSSPYNFFMATTNTISNSADPDPQSALLIVTLANILKLNNNQLCPRNSRLRLLSLSLGVTNFWMALFLLLLP